MPDRIEISEQQRLENQGWEFFHAGKFAHSYQAQKEAGGNNVRELFEAFNSQFKVAAELKHQGFINDCYSWFAHEYSYLRDKFISNRSAIPAGITDYFLLIAEKAGEISNPTAVPKLPVVTAEILAQTVSTSDEKTRQIQDVFETAHIQSGGSLPELLNEAGSLLEEENGHFLEETVKCHKLALLIAEIAGSPKSDADNYSQDYLTALEQYMKSLFAMNDGRAAGSLLKKLYETDYYAFAVAANRVMPLEIESVNESINNIKSVFDQLT